MKWYRLAPLWIIAISVLIILVQMIRLFIACKGNGVC